MTKRKEGKKFVRQHFIPVVFQSFWDKNCIHNGGSVRARKTKVFCMNLVENTFGRCFLTNSEDNFYEKELYTIKMNDGSMVKTIETGHMGEMDANYAATVLDIISKKDLVSKDRLKILLDFTSGMNYRNRRNIDFCRKVGEALSASSCPDWENYTKENFSEIKDEDVILAKIFSSEKKPRGIDFFEGFEFFCVYDFMEDCLFLGEDPVGFFNLPESDDCFYFMPLTPRHAIFIYKNMSTYEKVKQRTARETVCFLNTLSVLNSFVKFVIPSRWITSTSGYEGFGSIKHVYTYSLDAQKDRLSPGISAIQDDRDRLKDAAIKFVTEVNDGQFKKKSIAGGDLKYDDLLNSFRYIEFPIEKEPSPVRRILLSSAAFYFKKVGKFH